MTTLKSIVERLIDELEIGIYGTGTIAAGTLTDTTNLANANWGDQVFKDWWIWYAAGTGDERVKPASTLAAGGVLSQNSGVNWTTTGAAKVYRLLRPEWHPTRYVLPAINRGLELAWQWWRTVLTPVTNGDCENATVGGTDTSATTTRNTTAAYVYQGTSSYKVANSGANGNHAFADFDAAAGRGFRGGAWVRIAVGTATLKVIDQSNSGATIVSKSVTGVGQWHYIQFAGSFPATCYKAAITVGGDGATAETYWDDVTIYWEPETRVVGPSWLTQWKTEWGDDAVRFYKVRNRLTGDGTAAAKAYDLELLGPDKYHILNMPSAANPLEVELHRNLNQDMQPVVVEAMRRYLDFGELDLDADVTGCPERLAVAATKYVIAKDRGLPQLGQWQQDYWNEQRQGNSSLQTPSAVEEVRHGLAWVRIG